MGQYNSTTSWELALKPRLTYCKSSFKLPPLNSAPPPPHPFQGKKGNKRSPNYSSLINDHDRLNYESIKTEKLRVD